MTDTSTSSPRHLSLSAEHFTPIPFITAARRVLGEIDLDPASCERANEGVGAKSFFTREINGLNQPWVAQNAFVNPPGGKTAGVSNQKMWWCKTAAEYALGRVGSVIFLGFSIELLQVGQGIPAELIRPTECVLCFPRERIEFLTESNGELVAPSSPTHANVVVFLPPASDAEERIAAFRREFGRFGDVIVPEQRPQWRTALNWGALDPCEEVLIGLLKRREGTR